MVFLMIPYLYLGYTVLTVRLLKQVINPNNRGFTGHEHIDAVGIIHMNGRIYDPQLGRFLSADPNMQHPYSSQGQNRYAYVQNNPLKYVDMSGFGLFSKLWKGIKKAVNKILSHPIARIALAAAAAYFTAGAALGWAAAVGETAALVNAGAVGGATFGFIASGGDIKAALVGGLTGAAFAYVGNLARAGDWDGFEKALAHGALGRQ